MEKRPLGSQGLTPTMQGLGCMGMTFAYGEGDDDESIATIHRALELDLNFFDTAERYGPLENEKLLGRALADRRDEAFIATKFGIYADDGGGAYKQNVDGRPENVRRAIDGSLERLQTDHVELYQLHRVDPDVPIEETVGAMGELVEQGKVLGIGLSEASAETIRRAHATHPISSVQSEYSLWTRDPEENGVLETCRDLGIGFIAYSPLGRGFLTGAFKSTEEFGDDDFRPTTPRFQGENFERNKAIVERIEQMAEGKGVTAGQLALAWVHHQGEDVFPIPGTKRRKYLEENIAAAQVSLDTGDLEELGAIGLDVAGDRYSEAGMQSIGR
jgi:aryl-alcohol dehydrogenase-like predicted oxidoreductase